MPFDLTAMDEQLGEWHDDLPFTLTFSGADYTYNEVSMKTVDLDFMDRQIAQRIIQIIAIQASDFSTLPDRDDTLTIDGATRRVLETQDSPDGGLERRLFLGKEFQ